MTDDRNPLPQRHHHTRPNLPPSPKAYLEKGTPPPNLRDIEQTIYAILHHTSLAQHPHWHLVDEFRMPTAANRTSPIRNALWRRGFDVRQQRSTINPMLVQVWARWTHPIPDRPAPWEQQL